MTSLSRLTWVCQFLKPECACRICSPLAPDDPYLEARRTSRNPSHGEVDSLKAFAQKLSEKKIPYILTNHNQGDNPWDRLHGDPFSKELISELKKPTNENARLLVLAITEGHESGGKTREVDEFLKQMWKFQRSEHVAPGILASAAFNTPAAPGSPLETYLSVLQPQNSRTPTFLCKSSTNRAVAWGKVNSAFLVAFAFHRWKSPVGCQGGDDPFCCLGKLIHQVATTCSLPSHLAVSVSSFLKVLRNEVRDTTGAPLSLSTTSSGSCYYHVVYALWAAHREDKNPKSLPQWAAYLQRYSIANALVLSQLLLLLKLLPMDFIDQHLQLEVVATIAGSEHGKLISVPCCYQRQCRSGVAVDDLRDLKMVTDCLFTSASIVKTSSRFKSKFSSAVSYAIASGSVVAHSINFGLRLSVHQSNLEELEEPHRQLMGDLIELCKPQEQSFPVCTPYVSLAATKLEFEFSQGNLLYLEETNVRLQQFILHPGLACSELPRTPFTPQRGDETYVIRSREWRRLLSTYGCCQVTKRAAISKNDGYMLLHLLFGAPIRKLIKDPKFADDVWEAGLNGVIKPNSTVVGPAPAVPPFPLGSFYGFAAWATQEQHLRRLRDRGGAIWEKFLGGGLSEDSEWAVIERGLY